MFAYFSVPVSFCWSMTHSSKHNDSYIDNSTCIWTPYSPFCNDSFSYKFNDSGTYHLQVKVVNDVSMQISERKINVKLGKIVIPFIMVCFVHFVCKKKGNDVQVPQLFSSKIVGLKTLYFKKRIHLCIHQRNLSLMAIFQEWESPRGFFCLVLFCFDVPD